MRYMRMTMYALILFGVAAMVTPAHANWWSELNCYIRTGYPCSDPANHPRWLNAPAAGPDTTITVTPPPPASATRPTTRFIGPK